MINHISFDYMISPDPPGSGAFRFSNNIAILRNMEVTRYNFYLDEMIKRRNRHMINELEAKGCSPWMIPINTLFSSSSDVIMS